MDYRDYSKPNFLKTKSKVYADVLSDKPSSYYEYDGYVPYYETRDNYSLIRKLGHGKFSVVFEALHEPRKERVVIKVLKPIRNASITRELKVLECLNGGPNVIKLLSVVNDPCTDITSLIFEKLAHNEDFVNVYLNMSEADTRFYFREILKGLDYCHSKGIMHRDVKPQNIIIDQIQRKLKLIDWGLADFYHPGKEYNPLLGSKYFKAPELIVGYCYYDYSVDIWSSACVFASMLFKKEPFLEGDHIADQFDTIVNVLGSDAIADFVFKYNIGLPQHKLHLLRGHVKKPLKTFTHPKHVHFINEDSLNLLENLLQMDHTERLTAQDALKHKYFDPVKDIDSK